MIMPGNYHKLYCNKYFVLLIIYLFKYQGFGRLSFGVVEGQRSERAFMTFGKSLSPLISIKP